MNRGRFSMRRQLLLYFILFEYVISLSLFYFVLGPSIYVAQVKAFKKRLAIFQSTTLTT